jgi:hypothetical protein
MLVGAAAVVMAGCPDSNVGFLTAPTSIPTTQTGLQQAIAGLFSFTRNDQFQAALEMSAYAREASNFTSTEPRFIEYDLGINPIPVGAWISFWADEYQNIRSAQEILAAIPNAAPAFTTTQQQQLRGIVQTIEALNYLMVAWAHDSEGLAITQSPTQTSLPPAVCLKDGLQYIVNLLDSANRALDSAGSAPLPFKLPPGFGAVGSFAGPSTAAGSFAAFNRALAAKAGMELGFATSRPPYNTADTTARPLPPPATMAPADILAFTRADSAAKASALFVPTSLPPNPVGQWSDDAFTVNYDFSAASGDSPNPINGILGTQAVLLEVPDDQDTLHDLRWLAKFIPNPNPVQQPTYNFVASHWLYGMYPSPGSPLPIIRSETLTLTEAEIRMGLGDFAGALGYINDVRTEVGGEPANPGPANYANDVLALLHELQISTIFEGGADRVIAIRNFGAAVQIDTTWEHTVFKRDQHTTVEPVDAGELSGRGGTWTTVCNGVSSDWSSSVAMEPRKR